MVTRKLNLVVFFNTKC